MDLTMRDEFFADLISRKQYKNPYTLGVFGCPEEKLPKGIKFSIRERTASPMGDHANPTVLGYIIADTKSQFELKFERDFKGYENFHWVVV